MATNPNDAKEEVLAALCGNADPWTWGDSDQCSFSFNPNGTGAIFCGQNQSACIALEFSWSLTPTPPAPALLLTPDNKPWKFTIQITLSTRLHPSYHNRNPWISGPALADHLQGPPPSPSSAPFPWAPLHSAAFRPKEYTVTLTRGGRFIEPFDAFTKKPYPLLRSAPYRRAPNRYASRLVFESGDDGGGGSIYPPRGEWAEGGAGSLESVLDYQRFWERREFVREPIARKNETWAETLDLGWWLSPTVGGAYTR